MTENTTNYYEQIFNKERNEFFKLGGIHSGNYKRAKASYNAILLEYPDPKEWTPEIQQKTNDIAKEVELYYEEAKRCKNDHNLEVQIFDKEQFLKETLLNMKTIIKLKYLKPSWTRTYNTILRDFQKLTTDQCTLEIQEEIQEFVRRIWEHSFEI